MSKTDEESADEIDEAEMVDTTKGTKRLLDESSVKVLKW
jgi:hypothetical protein